MVNEFRLPDIGEGLTDAEVVTWHVAVGDAVTVDQILVEVETQGIPCEIVFKDISTVRGQPQRLVEFTKIISELAEEFAA